MELLLETARFVTYAAALQLFGAAAFQYWLAGGRLQASLDAALWKIAAASAVLTLAGQAAWLMAAAGAMGDGWPDAADPGVLWRVLAATTFGRIWGPLLLLGVATVGLAFWRRVGWLPLVIASTLLLCGLGLVGHAAAGTGIWGVLNRTSQILHLLSSAFWLGCLVPLLLCLRRFDDPAEAEGAAAALGRFSGLGHGAVAILLLSGVANSWFVLRDGGLDPSVPYQQLLLAKIAIAGTMVCLAIVNRYVFVPKIPQRGAGLRQLAHGTIAEIVLGAGLLALVAVLGTLPPQ